MRAASCKTKTIPCGNGSLTPGRGPLPAILHLRLWGCLVLPLLFSCVPDHRRTCLSQLCPWPGMCFLPPPNPPPCMGWIIHVTCHSQRGDSPRSIEVPLCSPAYVCPFGGVVPIVLSCSSTVCRSHDPMSSLGARGKCPQLLCVLSTTAGSQETFGSVCSKKDQRNQAGNPESTNFLQCSLAPL